MPPNPVAEPFFELHNLTADPEERENLTPREPAVLSRLRTVLDDQRDAKRLLPRMRNAV